MNNTIYRQDAIDAIDQYGSIWMEYTDSMSREEVAERALKASKQSMIKILHDLPSADKRGKWIMHLDDLFPAESTMECNQCHHEQPLTIDNNYCPNCGADMRGEEE